MCYRAQQSGPNKWILDYMNLSVRSAEIAILNTQLSLLREQQLIALHNAVSTVMSARDAAEYDERGHRIAGLYQRLARLFASPAEPQLPPSEGPIAWNKNLSGPDCC
jgi:hypothetical protein